MILIIYIYIYIYIYSLPVQMKKSMECVLLSEAHTAARTADLALPGEKARSPLVAPHHTTRACGRADPWGCQEASDKKEIES